MIQVADGIYLICDGYEGEFPTSGVYLVLGERAALVDTGPTSRAVVIPEALRDLGVDAGRIAYIMPTHIHVDHAGATGYLSRLYPHAQVVVHQAGARHLVDPCKLIESTLAVFGPEAEEAYGGIEAVSTERILATTGDELIDLGGGRQLRVINTAGHAPHHQSFYDERTHGIFTGEAMGIHHRLFDYVTPAMAPPLTDVFVLIASVRKIAAVGAERFYYAHGGAQENVEGVPERLVESILCWAELVRRSMREEPSLDYVAARLRVQFNEELRVAAHARGVEAPAPRDVITQAGGLMAFFNKFGLDVDLSGLSNS